MHALAVATFAQAGCGAQRSYPVTPQLDMSTVTAPAVAATARRIAPQDLLQITVFETAELSGSFRVSETGGVSLPLLGEVTAAGRTARELESAVTGRLRGTYIHDPHVNVEVKEAAPQPIYVLGEVNQPGAFSDGTQEGLTVLRAVSIARGLKPTASAGRTVVIRTNVTGERVQLAVNLNAVLSGRAPDIVLQANDVVYVPKNTERAAALGVVDALLRVVTFRTVF